MRLRFSHVRQLLVVTDLSLAAIVDRCGFEHPPFVAEAYKKYFGITPCKF